MEKQRINDITNSIRLFKLISACSNAGMNFSEYARFYKFTNEDLASTLSQMDLNDKTSALCPAASGDHALNLAYFGIKDIETFDCNRITEYYSKFKEMAVLCLRYEYFQKMMSNTKPSKNHELQKEVIRSLPEVYRKYWEEVMYAISQIKKENKGIFELDRAEDKGTGSSNNNIYQRSKEDFEKLKKNLRNTRILFTECDIKDTVELFGKKDIINYSNILEYRRKIFHNDYECAMFLKKVYEEQLSELGELMYYYNYYDQPDILSQFKEYIQYLDFGTETTYKSQNGKAIVLRKN